MNMLSDTNFSARPVVGRFAPSPTGRMHLGNAFSALMAWLAVRSQDGRIVMRIEDLDPRSKQRAYAQQLLEDLSWLGLTWDEGPYYQSDRTELYEHALEKLDALGLIYPCFCTRAELHAASAPHASDGSYIYAGSCRSLVPAEVEKRRQTREPALRLKVPAASEPLGAITFEDAIWGQQRELLAHECGDFLVRRSDGIFAYQLAVVVDDALMGITQVVRGRDLLGSAARQSYLHRLLGYEPPTFAHVPLLVANDGRRLSKRERDLDLGALREAGATPEQLVGQLAAAVGLAEAGEEVQPEQLIERFSWDMLRKHNQDIVMGVM